MATVASIGLIAFVVFGLRAPLWYDEANYLALAQQIKITGFPVWYWRPDEPELFINSPPLGLYILALVLTATKDAAVIRLLFFVVFGILPFVLIAAYCGAQSRLAAALSALFLAFTGLFLMEAIQARLDLPLAALTAIVVVVVAALLQGKVAASWATFLLLMVVSGAAYLTKYQAVVIGVALVLAAAWDWLATGKLRRALLFGIAANAAGGALAAVLLFLWLSAHGDNNAAESVQWNVVNRIAGMGVNFAELHDVLERIAQLVVVPLLLLGLAWTQGRIGPQRDPLLSLSICLVASVAAFNVVTYRMPGAGSYYMLQGIFALAYIFAVSTSALLRETRNASWIGTLCFVVLIHLALNTPPLTRILREGVDESIARTLMGRLQATDLLLLADENQSRAVPYLLSSSQSYGYLTSMGPLAVELALAGSDHAIVGAVVIPEWNALLSAPGWENVRKVLQSRYRKDGAVYYPMAPSRME